MLSYNIPGYPWNIFETEIRGMFFDYSGNIAL